MMADTTVLVLSAILLWLMIMTAAALRSQGCTPGGVARAFGNRDNMPEPTPLAGRAERAAKNMLEKHGTVRRAVRGPASRQQGQRAGAARQSVLLGTACLLANLPRRHRLPAYGVLVRQHHRARHDDPGDAVEQSFGQIEPELPFRSPPRMRGPGFVPPRAQVVLPWVPASAGMSGGWIDVDELALGLTSSA